MRRTSTNMLGLAIDYRKTEAEQGMLLNLHKRGWTEGLRLKDFNEQQEGNEKAVKVSTCTRRSKRYLRFVRTIEETRK